jgi:hypothetical protein
MGSAPRGYFLSGTRTSGLRGAGPYIGTFTGSGFAGFVGFGAAVGCAVVVVVGAAVGLTGGGTRSSGRTGAGPYTGATVGISGTAVVVVFASLVELVRPTGSTAGGPYTAAGGRSHPASARPAVSAIAANVPAPLDVPQCGHEVSVART